MDQPAVIAAELANLGEVDVRRGDYQQAISNLRQALALLRQTGGQHREIFALRVLAQALHGDGQPVAARAELMTALRLVTETGNTYRHASVHCDLADSYCGDAAGTGPLHPDRQPQGRPRPLPAHHSSGKASWTATRLTRPVLASS